MTADAGTGSADMTYLGDLGSLVEVSAEATVSRTVLKAEGVRLVLFSFDAGQELSEHTVFDNADAALLRRRIDKNFLFHTNS